jgi:osmotically-inducible protein OsmY
MKNLKSLVLTGSAAIVIALVAFTGCKSNSSSGERSAGREKDDSQITEQVKEKLEAEPMYKFTDVDVRTFAGVVQLNGFVNSEDEKRRAGEIARTVPGVAEVANNISLKPGATMSPTSRTNDVNKTDPPK